MSEQFRSQVARLVAERLLAEIVTYYGSLPEFVVLGGLVPKLLCSRSEFQHAGTTDIDVHVDLEIMCGAKNAVRLERALKKAGMVPDKEHIWRWVTSDFATKTIVKFELLADLESQPSEAVIKFDNCEYLGAVNLRGTGYASRVF